MNIFVIANNVQTTLSSATSSTGTTFTLSSSANLPTLLAGQMMPITFTDAATRLTKEICYVTNISGTTLTVIRAREGTGAQNWSVGDGAACLPTAGTVALLQNVQAGTYNSSIDSGAVNAYSAALTPAILAYVPGAELWVNSVLNGNTGVSTLSVNGLASMPIHGVASADLQGGEIVAGYAFKVRVNSAATAFDLIETTGGSLSRGDLQAADIVSDYIVSGINPTVPSPASLSMTIPAGAAYILGQRTVLQSAAANTYPVSSDTYVSMTNTGVVAYASVANGAAAPAAPANAINLLKVVTSPIVSPVPTITAGASGGTLAAGTYQGAIVAHDATGYGAVSASVSITVVANGTMIFNWVNPLNETSADIYATTAGLTTLGLVASGVTGTTYTYTGAVAPGAAAPTVATSNAIQRIVRIALDRPYIQTSVLTCGADRTGATYSDEAFYEAAELALANGNTGSMYIPAGQYYLSPNFKPININQKIAIHGEGSASLIVVNGGGANCVFHVTNGGADIRNFSFFGINSPGMYGVLADTTALNGYNFSNLHSNGMRGCFKISVAQSAGGSCDCSAINGYNGFEIDAMNSFINHCQAINNQNQGFIFTSVSGQSANIVSNGCTAYGNPNGNWVMQGNATYSIDDALISGLTCSYSLNAHGVLVDTYGSGNEISSSYVEFAGGDTAGAFSAYDGVHITNNNYGLRMVGVTSRYNGKSGIYSNANGTQFIGCATNENAWDSTSGGTGLILDVNAISNIQVIGHVSVNQNDATAAGIGMFATSYANVSVIGGSTSNGIYFANPVEQQVNIIGINGYVYNNLTSPLNIPSASSSIQAPNKGQTDSLYQSSLLSVSSTTTSGAITATAAQLAGQYLSDGATQTAAFTVTTDTATNILAAMPNAVVGTAFKWRFINNDQSATGYAGTLAGGTGVTVGTVLPNPAVPKGGYADYVFIFTAIGATPTLTVDCVGGDASGLL